MESGYRINLAESESATIHKASCRHASGREKDVNWWGIYATLGAAIDAALASHVFGRAREGRCCIAPRINVGS